MKCDYLLIGAGASSLAFLDTLLTENPSAKVVLVDKKPSPGGHWVDDYDYVKLHQPSIVYGIASRQLEGNWMKLLFRNFMLPWNHRASKAELLTHFQEYIQDKIDSGRLEYYPNCQYDFSSSPNDGVHSFSSLDGRKSYEVEVGIKLINGVLGENQVPSQCPVKFPVDKGITLVTPNDLYHAQQGNGKKGEETSDISKSVLGNTKRYIVLGCGKTAMDTVVYLRSVMKIKQERISWVIPNDVWMLAREGGGNPGTLLETIVELGDEKSAIDSLEKQGILVRLDKKNQPTRFRFPMIGKDELKYMRGIKDIIRRGRVTSIDLVAGNAKLNFGPEKESWTSSNKVEDDVFIHCTSPGPFNDNTEGRIFLSDKEMNLLLLYSPPISISMSCLAYLETARTKGKLNLEFGRELIRAADGSEERIDDNDVLKRLFVTELSVSGKKKGGAPSEEQAEDFGKLAIMTSLNLALFMVMADLDPMVGYQWLKLNRLSFLSIPGFKCKIHETMKLLSEKEEGFLGLSSREIRMLALLATKLEPLKGM